MSGQFPVSPGPKDIEWESFQPVFSKTSSSGRRHARKLAGHLWRLVLNFDLMRQSQAAPFMAFYLKNDASEKFYYQWPRDNKGVGLTSETTAAIDAVGGVVAGSASFVIKNLTPNVVGKFKAGDWINIASTEKVHMIVDDADTDALGKVTVTVKPETIDAFTDNDSVTVNKPNFSVSFIGPVHKFKTGSDGVYRIEANLEESL